MPNEEVSQSDLEKKKTVFVSFHNKASKEYGLHWYIYRVTLWKHLLLSFVYVSNSTAGEMIVVFPYSI